jgi:hypothetical protein
LTANSRAAAIVCTALWHPTANAETAITTCALAFIAIVTGDLGDDEPFAACVP